MLQKLPKPTSVDIKCFLLIIDKQELRVPVTLNEVAIDEYNELTIFEMDQNGYRREIHKSSKRRSESVSRNNEIRTMPVQSRTESKILSKTQRNVIVNGDQGEGKKLPIKPVQGTDRTKSGQLGNQIPKGGDRDNQTGTRKSNKSV